MDHSQHGGAGQHPDTFDEVIARGFPHSVDDQPTEADAEPPIASAPTLPRLTADTGPVATRVDQASFPPGLQTAFKNAVVRLVADGIYDELIRHHTDMSHRMHGSMGEVGLYRFLGWHRRYLIAFERELQRVDAVLRPGTSERLGVPYWRWQDPFPAWMIGFLPAKDPATGGTPGPRKTASPPEKATAADVDTIVNRFSIQHAGVTDANDYTRFTWGVEGWGRRPNGTSLPAHNHGHSWIGGIMNNTRTSPTDPMFWLHHAQVDHLWHCWRQKNATARPRLSGSDLIMDPWAESYDELLDPTSLGYVYDSTSP